MRKLHIDNVRGDGVSKPVTTTERQELLAVVANGQVQERPPLLYSILASIHQSLGPPITSRVRMGVFHRVHSVGRQIQSGRVGAVQRKSREAFEVWITFEGKMGDV